MSDSSNVFDLFIDATSGVINISEEIVKQKLTLLAYRIEYDSAAEALAGKYIKLEMQIFGNNTDTAKNSTTTSYAYSDNSGLVLPIDNAIVTLQTGVNIPIDMATDLTKGSNFNLRSADLTGFAGLHLIFGYSVI